MDENTLFSRLKRYGGHSTLFATLTKEYIKGDLNQFYKKLVSELGIFKGPLMKVGQLLSMVPGVIPEEYKHMLKKLQAQAPAMGPLFVKRRMRGELGHNWENLFSDFTLTPAAAASIGQVHKAHTQDGQAIACKLQYPNMAGILESDLNQLKLLFMIYESQGGSFKTGQFFEETKAHLYEEIDYIHEAKSLRTFKKIFSPAPFIHIPDVMDCLSTRRLLTMSWMDGVPIEDVTHLSTSKRKILTERLFWAWYYPLYGHGYLHGDPHAGNFLFAEDGHIVLLDFGCVRKFSTAFLEGTRLLYQKLKHQKTDCREAYALWGFQNLTPELVDTLNRWSSFLYGPITENKVQKINNTYNVAVGKKLAKEVLAELKKQGKIELPREFVLMHRAAVGMGAAFIQLDAPLNWQSLFEEMLHAADRHQKGNISRKVENHVNHSESNES